MQRILLSALFCLFLAPVIKADDVVITSGALIYPSFITAPFQYNFSGQDLVVIGGNIATEAAGPFCIPGGANQPCIGANLNFGAGLNSGGQVTYQGTTYELRFLGPHLNLGFNAGQVLVPPELWNANAVMITTPFTFGGSLAGIPGPSITFTGQGFVQALLVRGFPEFGLSGMREVNYTFLPPGTPPPPTEIRPIPEPASMLLFATGLLGVIGRIRKSTKK